jgi:O-antigen/teichoic acid export membrane protein
MSRLKSNIIANFLGRGWSAIMGLAFVPLYIKFMGIEAYGIVGFSVIIQSISNLLDMGLSSTLNRELAILSSKEGTTQESRDLVRTLETIYWSVTVVIGLSVSAISPLLAKSWIRSQQLSPDSIQLAIALMGVVIACQFPFSLYSGGLLGLQKQVLLSGITVTMATLRGIGMILVLWLVSPTIQAFFIWQAIVSLLQTIVTAFFLWRSLPASHIPSHFRKDVWLRIWRFAASMSGISLVSVILIQADKMILSKMLTLENFGYYNLAGTVASGVTIVTSPIFSSVYPRFSQLVAQGEEVKLTVLYHKISQLLSLLVIPLSVTLSIFSKDVLLLWTGSPEIAEKTYLLVSILTISTSLHSLMNVPYALQLAYGWTKLAFYINVVAIGLLIPLMLSLTSYYSAVGAAVVWIILTSGYILIGIPLMHSRLLKREMFKWYYQDVAKPLIAAISVGLISQEILKRGAVSVNLWILLLVWISTFLVSILMTELGTKQLKLFSRKAFKL